MPPGHSRTRIVGALVTSLGFLFVLSSSALLSGCGSPDDNRPAQWSYIYPAIIEPSCATASCHSNFTRRAGVNFSGAVVANVQGTDVNEAWFQLACRHFVVECPPAGMTDLCATLTGTPVTPSPACGTPAAVTDSQLLYQLRATGASRMPPDFPLPDADIDLISTWIANGAQNN